MRDLRCDERRGALLRADAAMLFEAHADAVCYFHAYAGFHAMLARLPRLLTPPRHYATPLWRTFHGLRAYAAELAISLPPAIHLLRRRCDAAIVAISRRAPLRRRRAIILFTSYL